MNKLHRKHEELNLHSEHEFATVSEKVANLVGKLEKREDGAEKRIENLESVVKIEVEGTLAGRLDHLEKQMKGNVESKINALNKQLDTKIARIEELVKKMEAVPATKGEKPRSEWPFYFLLLVVMGHVGATVYLRFSDSKKWHLP